MLDDHKQLSLVRTRKLNEIPKQLENRDQEHEMVIDRRFLPPYFEHEVSRRRMMELACVLFRDEEIVVLDHLAAGE